MDSVIGCRITGATHVRVNKVCQDYYKIVNQSEYTIMAVADGHGSSSCPYSDDGSRIATREFCRLLDTYFEQYRADENSIESLEGFLRKEGMLSFAKQVEREWKRHVIEWHMKNAREIPEGEDKQVIASKIHLQYGTTLVGLMVTESFVFAFQLGDGDITYIDAHHTKPLIEPDKFLGVETHSLSKNDAWKKAVSGVFKRDITESSPCLYMMTTDGMANSYRSASDFYKACTDYYALFQNMPMPEADEKTDEPSETPSTQNDTDTKVVDLQSPLLNPKSEKDEKEPLQTVMSQEVTSRKNEPDEHEKVETGIGYLQRNLPAWLEATSREGCGDDITVVFYYHE